MELGNTYVGNNLSDEQVEKLNKLEEMNKIKTREMIKKLKENEVVIQVPIKIVFMENKANSIGFVERYNTSDIFELNF